MNKILRIMGMILRLLSTWIRPGKVLVFCSYPAFTDNAYAIYRHIISKDLFKDYQLVWIVLNPKDCKKELIPHEIKNSHLVVVSKKSIRAVGYYLRARYVFFTHGLYSNLPIARPHTIINLFHGMPLKRIGLMDHKGHSYMDNTQILIATSELFQRLMAQSFGKSLHEVLILGQPRNDLMFEPTNFYEKAAFEKSAFERIGIWLPTYRSSTIGDIRIDGKFEEGKISFLDSKDLNRLDDFLVQKNILLIIKLHPMDQLQNADFELFSNLKIIKQKDFTSQLYPLIGSTDFMLTDYSSVWIDYDILGKPMGFVIDDMEAYQQSRGFTIENLSQELPGMIINDLASLYDFLSNPGKHLVLTGNKFNKYKDNKSSARLLDWLEEGEKGKR